MAEGVVGLTRDKTRKPGKPPLPVATVQRVVDLALSPLPGSNPLDRPNAGEGGWRELAIGAAHPCGSPTGSAWHPNVQAVQRPEVRGETQGHCWLLRRPAPPAPRFVDEKEIPWGADSDRRSGRAVAASPTLEATMQIVTDRSQAPTAIRTDLGAIFVSLELSRSTWLITSLLPGGGEKMSKHMVRSGDVAGLWSRFSQLKDKVLVRTGQVVPIIVIQEAGLDGFWIHRLLRDKQFESHVVDLASIATSRRRRRAKTDKIDGEALVRALLAYKRGEPRVCAMVRAPTPQEEDRRQICRERKTLTAERVEHVNRIKGLLFAQGISDYKPLLRKRRERLEELRTGDGRPLPEHLKAQIRRDLDQLELTLQQIKSVEIERNAMLSPSDDGTPASGEC